MTTAQQAQYGAYSQAQTMAQPQALEHRIAAQAALRDIGVQKALYPYGVEQLQAEAAGDRAALAEQRQRAAVDTDYYNKLLGFAPRGFNLAEQLVGIGRDEAGATRATATRNLNSDFTARGAWGSEFQRAGLGDIEGEFTRTGRGLDVKSGQNQLGLEQDIASAQHGLFGAQASARGAGARTAAIDRQLKAGLAKLGIQHVTSLDDLWMGINNNNARAAAVMQAALAAVPPVAGAGFKNTPETDKMASGSWGKPKRRKKPVPPTTMRPSP